MATITDAAREIYATLTGHFNDLEYLAQLVEDSTISSSAPGNEIQSRLVAIFEASSDGSAGGVTHFDKIFSGTRDRGFRFDFKDGSNQVGHFMTAVDMGFRPTKTSNYAASLGVTGPRTVRLPNMFGGIARAVAPVNRPGGINVPWEEEICIRLIIGHEQVSDEPNPKDQWKANAMAPFGPTDEEVTRFYLAADHVPVGSANLEVTRLALTPIRIGNGIGNSMMDLHLSLYGYQFGRFIRKGQIATRRAAATWLRWNIGGTFAFVQRA